MNSLPSVQRAKMFEGSTAGNDALSAALSILPDHTDDIACWLIEQGACAALSPRQANGIYHRVYAQGAGSESDPAYRVLTRLWSMGVGKQIRGECWTPAHMASGLKNQEQAIAHLRTLESLGFDLDTVDEVGETPVMVAAWKSTPATVVHLLNRGADMLSQTNSGRGVFDYALRALADGSEEDEQDTVGLLCWLRDRGYPVESSLARHDFRDEALRSRVEAALLQRAAPSATLNRSGLRL